MGVLVRVHYNERHAMGDVKVFYSPYSVDQHCTDGQGNSPPLLHCHGKQHTSRQYNQPTISYNMLVTGHGGVVIQ